MFLFEKQTVEAVFRKASGEKVIRPVEIRKNPVLGNSSRITFSRSKEIERGLEKLYQPPPEDMESIGCPFCRKNIETATPMLSDELNLSNRLIYKNSVLFPNLYPYTEWSGVSIFDERHYVEIGTASVSSYRDCLINCSRYLHQINEYDSNARFMGITQNHLPAAGGSLVHPHLQVHATASETNAHRQYRIKAKEHKVRFCSRIFTDLITIEKKNKIRYIGNTGCWEWISAFAPDGFYEIWAIAPEKGSLIDYRDTALWEDLARGILNTQRFFRSMNRNSYNLGVLSIEGDENSMDLMVSIKARSSYAPWVRSDITGFEMAFQEMATFSSPESTAEKARVFWRK